MSARTGLVVLGACAEGPVDLRPSTPLEPDPRWEVLAPLPEPRQECGVAAVDGGVAVVGGYGDGDTFGADGWWYSPDLDAWTELPALPRPVHHPNVAVLDDGVHVAGALGEGFLEAPDHWRLGPGADRWERLEPLPDDVAVGAAGVAVLDGRLHLVGGLHGGATVAFHTAWDPGRERWERLPDAPTRRDHFLLVAVGGALVALGGRVDGLTAFTPRTERWDGRSWTPGAPIPTPRGGVLGAVDGDGRVHVLGGEGNPRDPDGVFGAHEVYDPGSDTWSTLPPMSSPRHGTGAAWLDGAMYVPGGAPVQRFGAVDTHERWTPLGEPRPTE